VTTVTDLLFGYPSFFGRRVLLNRQGRHDRLVQKIALTAIVDQADNSTKSHSCREPSAKRRAANFVGPLFTTPMPVAS
jgi:hypothetical protein